MKRVLVACECSGVVRDAFRARGHDAWSCDLQPDAGGSSHHIKGDVLGVLDDGWDLLIAHPECRYLSVSGMHWTTRGLRDPKLTQDAIRFAETLWDAPIKQIAIENPVGILSTQSRLGKPAQTIQPYEFGEDASKRTCLWLCGLPLLVADPADYVKPRLVCGVCKGVNTYDAAFGHGCGHCGADAGKLRPRWSNQTDSGQNRLGPSAQRSQIRATTYPGIAKAFALQWSPLLQNNRG